ncbi:hypothetical protein LTR10_005705 [Elasticomyces elasticus]|nr:hypothetical protein LTR10_005705 [Elasticomyces elasticus]KAK4976441.1 hypothetical protein LTR42_004072 [Elasticomyces elasticus]
MANHEHHRMHRAALNPFSSGQTVAKMQQSIVQPMIDKAFQAFSAAYESRKPVDTEAVMVALTTDIVTEYAFAKSYGFLDRPGYVPEWIEVLKGAAESSMLFRYLPFMIRLIMSSPEWLVKMFDPKLMQLLTIKAVGNAETPSVFGVC